MSLQKYGLWILITLCLAYTGYKAFDLVQTSRKLQALEETQASVIKIDYGLFNMDAWKEKALSVFSDRLHNFEISPAAYKEVDLELRGYLQGIYKDYLLSGKLFDKLIKEAEEKQTVPPMLLNMFKTNLPTQIKNLQIEKQIPDMAATLTAELKKKEPRIKEVLGAELDKLLVTSDTIPRQDQRAIIAASFNQPNLPALLSFLNDEIIAQKAVFKSKAFDLLYLLLGLTLLSFLAYIFVKAKRNAIIGILSVISLIFLYVGVQLPMIVIDARLNAFEFVLLNQSLNFDQQSIFFQSKSILDVTQTLLDGRTIDLKIVGILVLCFSIVFPIIKLVLSGLYLAVDKIQNSSFARGLIFHLGKWSMADVFVVALFMAYIGFHGLADAQLDAIESNKTGFAVETANYTHLDKGALFFSIYCVLSIVIGSIISHIHLKKSDL
ncbi:MAG: paraquat-inducible protein A [Saprospiraceae bacterium]|nr:paraquat-inducible protein A [Saprospiraceae bacterium]